jgi:glycosyltransferase involved in cell wall biosynthesis
MRILIAAEARLGAGGSGAERVLHAHVRALRARGHQLLVLCPDGALAAPSDVATRAVGWSATTPWRALAAARPALARGGVDAVVLHHPLPGTLLADAAERARVPVLALVHSPWREEYEIRGGRGLRGRLLGRVRAGLERRVLTRARRVCAMSRFMAARVVAAHGLPAERVRIVPGGVDRVSFVEPTDRRAVRRRLALPETGPLLFCLRNLEPRMGIEHLLGAMPAVLARHPDAHLVIGGDGPLAVTLRERTTALGLDAAVRFAGFVAESELPHLYAAADVFVLPSEGLEGFGLVTLESLACGTPVIGTRVGATPELLEPLDPALLADAPTPDALARAILAFLSRGDRASLAARCRAHTAPYAWDRVAGRLEAELLALTH